MFERVAAGATISFLFSTYDSDGSNVAPSSAFEAADVRIYKDGSATQRSSESGYTMTSPFDSLTGVHQISIDLSDDTDSGFYAVGSRYEVVATPDETVDGQSVSAVIGRFRIVPAEASAGVPDVNVASIDNDAITAAAVATGAIDADAIAADAITEAKIADDAIAAEHIATDAITAAKLATDCIGADEIADGAIDAGAIATDAITAVKIAADAISSSELAAAAATEIADAVASSEVGLSDAAAAKVADVLLRRTYEDARSSSNGSAVSRRSLLGMIAQFVNTAQQSGSTLSIKHEDGSDFYSLTLTTDPGADPVTARE